MQFQSIALSQPLEVVFEPTHFPPDFPFVLWPTGRPGELREKAAYLHYHNELEIGWCVSGSGVFFVEEKVIPFRAPCVSLIYGGQIHIAQSSPGEGAQWYFVNTDARALGLGDFPGHTAAPVIAADEPGGQELAALAELLVEELRGGAPDAGRCAQGLVQAMLCRHARLGGGAPGSSWRIAEISPRRLVPCQPLRGAVQRRAARPAVRLQRGDAPAQIPAGGGLRAAGIPAPHPRGGGVRHAALGEQDRPRDLRTGRLLLAVELQPGIPAADGKKPARGAACVPRK